MKLVIFGLSISSSWGNGHATLWRGLLRALAARGHRTVFFERDVPYYAAHRDLDAIDGVELVLYPDWEEVRRRAARELSDADAGLVTSYCPDSTAACALVRDARGLRVFYDLDTPVTLDRLAAGETVEYVPPGGYAGFDVVLSYTGGSALEQLRTRLGAAQAVPVYGSVDPATHFPVAASPGYGGDLSYLGTFAADRQAALTELFVEPARLRPEMRFVMGGAMYDNRFPWTPNIYFRRHVPPPDHPDFYCSSRATLNVTRRAMAEAGWCPSGRLFEAAACGVPILTDVWEGLDSFFTPGTEIWPVRTRQDVLAGLDLPATQLQRMGQRARERALEEHTSQRRAIDFENALAAVGVGA